MARDFLSVYDFIGDIHGNLHALKQLLARLGYQRKHGAYGHPTHTAVFLGDLINKGPDSKGVLKTVRAMVDQGNATTLLGNHELNFIAYHTPRLMSQTLRSHNAGNRRQLEKVHASLGTKKSTIGEWRQWLMGQPLYLDMERWRAIHAHWHWPSLRYVEQHHPSRRLSEEWLSGLWNDKHPGAQALEAMLVGPSLLLPHRQYFWDAYGRKTSHFKVKWWHMKPGTYYEQLAVKPQSQILNERIFMHHHASDMDYPQGEPLLFFGHYNLNGPPYLLAPHYTCVDFGGRPHRRLCAYRWEGEATLSETQLICV